ncbi:hypothetical protein C8F01DRAFT_331640 [Mycena amicta]|nr:hypothetical protein C8F01DRAFT_331640 [Mycena amicta]
MFQYLTHTSPNWYSREVWDSSVMLVHRKVRGFKVGLALVFADRDIAFLSHDLVFQVSLLLLWIFWSRLLLSNHTLPSSSLRTCSQKRPFR